MNLEMYLSVHRALVGTSSTIFAILIGFTLFMLNQGGKKVELSAAVLLGMGIFGSLIATGVSTVALLVGANNVIFVDSIYISAFFLFFSMTGLGILTFMAISQLYAEQVHEDRRTSSWDFMKLR